MSHTTKIFSNQSIKNHHRAFLSHKDEPREKKLYLYSGMLADLDVELLRSSLIEKRKFRRAVKKLKRYAI